MPASRKASLDLDSHEFVPRRIRHITSIHIANFTPFPVRDEFTSALSRPSEQPQYTEYGHLSDDLDLTLGRKRGRRRSSTVLSNASYTTIKDSPRVSHEPAIVAEAVPRRRTSSKPTLPSSKVRSPGSGPPITRPPLRHRTVSTSSSISHFTAAEPSINTNGASTSSLNIVQDTSQPTLEKILSSRLVETFITVTVTQEASEGTSVGHIPPTRGIRRNTVSAANSDASPRPRRVPSSSTSVRPPSFRDDAPSHGKSISMSSPTTNGHRLPKPSSPKPFSPKNLRHLASPRIPPASNSRSSTPEHANHNGESPTPDYLSPIHRPSVNPGFYIDARSGSDFAPGTNLSGCDMIVEVWANEPSNFVEPSIVKGKGKERVHHHNGGEHNEVSQWKVLQTWEVNLNDMVPFPSKASIDTSYVYPNTLCVVLEPPGQTFYLPQSRASSGEILRSRSPSPSAGYNSDPESHVRSIKPLEPIPSIYVPTGTEDETREDIEEMKDGVPHPKRKGRLKSASWQDLLKLVTLQAVIGDTQHSLSEIVRDLDSRVVHNAFNVSLREASEREAWVHELRTQKKVVNEQSNSLRARLAVKSEELRKRREALQCAREAHAHDLRDAEVRASEIDEERGRLTLFRNRLPIIRNSLFTSLAFIYPIELVSSPDLLFSILDVPLPIPVGPTDPAPPLSLPSHKEVTEDSVATALGYAAQVVQLLAAYLGQGLIYPVTCVGSRSLIKDGISMMVGPRMFPLFSKGVDTYRFEYGVFLLNKDIELLMAERNLRALDVRHTLPNLKNLLLTLTDPDLVEICPHRPLSVASTTISALQSPVISPATPPELNTPVADSLDTQTVGDQSIAEGESPPPSGATTPTKSAETHTPTNTVRKPRGFLDLSGFFRGRQPSISRASVKAESSSMAEQDTPNGSVSVANGDASQAVDEGNTGGDDDDDRRTIRASVSEDIAERKLTNAHANGHPNGNGTVIAHSHQQTAAEKAASDLHASQVVDSIS